MILVKQSIVQRQQQLNALTRPETSLVPEITQMFWVYSKPEVSRGISGYFSGQIQVKLDVTQDSSKSLTKRGNFVTPALVQSLGIAALGQS